MQELGITSISDKNKPHSLIDEKNYDIWINKFYTKFSLPYPIISIFFGLMVFVLGIIIAYFDNFHKTYVSSAPIYLGIVGIIWVSTFMEWGAKNYIKILNNVRPYFNVSDSEYLETTEKWVKLIYNDKLVLGLSFFFIIFTYFVVFLVYHYKIATLMIFPNEWYLPPTFYKILIINIYGTVIALLVVTSGAALILNILLMNDLGKKPVFFYPNLAKKLMPLCNFNLITAITWLIGSALIASAIYDKFDVFTFAFELILVVIGILTFFVPQISLHRTLKKSKNELLDKIDRICENEYKFMYRNMERFSDWDKDQIDLFTSFYTLDKFRNTIESQSKTWIYDLPAIIWLLGASSLTFFRMVSNLLFIT